MNVFPLAADSHLPLSSLLLLLLMPSGPLLLSGSPVLSATRFLHVPRQAAVGTSMLAAG